MNSRNLVRQFSRKSKVNKRDPYFDVVRAISITSIVIGHCWEALEPFVYLYHMAIFFFLGSCLILKDKPENINPFAVLSRLFKNNYFKYLLFCFVFLFLNNVFFFAKFIYDFKFLTLSETLVAFVKIFIFEYSTPFLGAFWFIPVYICAIFLSSLIVYVCNKISVLFKKNVVFIVLLLFFILSIGYFGCWLNNKGYVLQYYTQTSILMIPICLLAFLINYLRIDVKKFSLPILTPIFFTILLMIILFSNYRIELSKNLVGEFYIFYPVTLVGICFCFCLASLFCKLSILVKPLSYVGKNTFYVMALHFLVFKTFDRILCLCIGQNDPEIFGHFPVTFDNLGVVYTILGVLIPVLIKYSIDIFCRHLNKTQFVQKYLAR